MRDVPTYKKKSCRYCCHLWSRPRTFQTTHTERAGGSLPHGKALKVQSYLLCLLSRLRICDELLACLQVAVTAQLCIEAIAMIACVHCESVDWILLAHVRVQWCVMVQRNEASFSVQCGELLD